MLSTHHRTCHTSKPMDKAKNSYLGYLVLLSCFNDVTGRCYSTSECTADGFVCSDSGECVSIAESTGIQTWVIATIVIAVTLVIFALGGCCCLWPSCPGSGRFAHPIEKEKMRLKLKEMEEKQKSRQSDNVAIYQNAKNMTKNAQNGTKNAKNLTKNAKNISSVAPSIIVQEFGPNELEEIEKK